MMNLNDFGNRMRAARENRHLSQDQLAELIGLSPIQIGILEQGTKPPRFETLINIANALDVSANYLLQDNIVRSSHDLSPEFADLLSKLSPEDQWRILCSLRAFVECTPATL